MFSSLSAIADRNFVVAFLLPVIAATIGIAFVFQDVQPITVLWQSITTVDSFSSLTLIVLFEWLAAVLLSIFNVEIFQILEGYVGPFATAAAKEAAEGLRERRRDKLVGLHAAADDEEAAEKLRAAQFGEPIPENHPAKTAYLEATRKFAADFPRADLVLPTRFGNVVRSAEMYSTDIYGLDSIKSWFRMVAVIPKDYLALIDAIRADVDFFVSFCFLAALIAAVCFIAACAQMIANWPGAFGPLYYDDIFCRRAVACIVSALISWLAYEGAIERARPWGEFIRSAYDLYLFDLPKQFGLDVPDNADAVRPLWDLMNSLFIDYDKGAAEGLLRMRLRAKMRRRNSAS